MARANRSNDEARLVALGEDLRIAHAAATFETLATAAAGGTVAIDASQVARVDAAGLQALAAGLARLHAAGIECRWQQVSATLSTAASLAGLGAALALK